MILLYHVVTFFTFVFILLTSAHFSNGNSVIGSSHDLRNWNLAWKPGWYLCWPGGSISLPVLAISLLTIIKRRLTHAMPCKSISISWTFAVLKPNLNVFHCMVETWVLPEWYDGWTFLLCLYFHIFVWTDERGSSTISILFPGMNPTCAVAGKLQKNL